MKKFDFITLGEDKYIEPLKVSVLSAKKFYPDNSYFIYDIGLSNANKQLLVKINPQVVFFEWTCQFVELSINMRFLDWIRFLRQFLKQQIVKKTKGEKSDSLVKVLHNKFTFEIKIFNKLLCIKDFAEQTDRPFIFIDADAFLINKIDDLITSDIEIGLTVRRRSELSFRFNECRLLNTGVLFFLSSPNKNRLFIKTWWKHALETHEQILEQTSLSRLIEKKVPHIFHQLEGKYELIIDKESFRLELLSSDIYNYNWIEEFDPDKHMESVKILHFKSGRFQTPLFKKLANKLKLYE